MIAVEKGIPLPGRKHHKYPFDEMDVGDSFFIPAKSADDAARAQVSALGAMRARRLLDKDFTTRRVDGGVRVWRIA